MNRDEIEHQLATARKTVANPAADNDSLRGHIIELIGIVQMLLHELERKAK